MVRSKMLGLGLTLGVFMAKRLLCTKINNIKISIELIISSLKTKTFPTTIICSKEQGGVGVRLYKDGRDNGVGRWVVGELAEVLGANLGTTNGSHGEGCRCARRWSPGLIDRGEIRRVLAPTCCQGRRAWRWGGFLPLLLLLLVPDPVDGGRGVWWCRLGVWRL